MTRVTLTRLAAEISWLIASELRAVNVDLCFAPCVDLDWGFSEIIGDRSFHADAEAVGELAAAVRGANGDDSADRGVRPVKQACLETFQHFRLGLDHLEGLIADGSPEIVAAVGGRVPVIVDGGFRRGTDIFKALALGANAVAIGRPYVWGLGAFGQAGVEKVLEILRTEFRRVMQEAGVTSVAQIDSSYIERA